MNFLFSIFRVCFFYILYFIGCLVFAAIALQSWSDGWQALFMLAFPALIVFTQEKRRAEVKASQGRNEQHSDEGQGASPAPEGPASSRYEMRVEAERHAIRKEAAKETVGQTWKKQDYGAIVQASQHAAPALAKAAKRAEISRNSSTRKPSRQKSGWVDGASSASVAGRDIGGFVYVGTPPLLNDYGYRDKCRAYIDPSLSVARSGSDKVGDHMPYWPGYSDIPAQCRATYLDWLASGRDDATYNPGYMFLYFYGLERRFVVDQPNLVEKQRILDEVLRLKDLYPDNGSVQRYLGDFIEFAQISVNTPTGYAPIFEHRGWELPLGLKVALGEKIGRGEHLTADWVLSWLICHPEGSLRTPAKRCPNEFRSLFGVRFDKRFSDGLKLNKPRKKLTGSYQAASREFDAKFNLTDDGKPIPDISGLRKPIEIAQEIADEVMDDLDKLSRYLGRNPDGAGSLEALALVPLELLNLHPNKELEALKAWASEIINSDGLVPVSKVIARLEGAQPDKLTKRHLTGAADALARIGVGFAPDPRFALRSPKIGEPVKLFHLSEPVAKLEDVSDAFRAALLEAALGAFVAHADGQITSSERSALLANAQQALGLHALETTRLLANLDWMLAVAPDLSLLRRKLKGTGADAQAAIRAALVSAAHADGIVQSEEVAGIEKIYKVLGLDPNLVYSDLHAGDVSDGPIQVRQAEPSAPGEAIPQADAASAFRLDTSKIASTQKETAQVSSLLGSIFDETEGEAEGGNDVTAFLPGLDAQHVAFIREIIVQDCWANEAFQALCARHGLMASGAIEDVNEWAFDAYDDAILEEYDGYEVNPEIAAELKTLFEKEGKDVQIETA